MKKFNPEKELNNIKYGHTNKVIVIAISLLVISIIGFSFALYEISNKKELIYSTVAAFTKVTFSLPQGVSITPETVLLTEKNKQKEFKVTIPDGMILDQVTCSNSVVTDKEDYTFKLNFVKSGNSSCVIKVRYKDNSGANAPELNQGLIPIYFKDNKAYIADITKEWYDYNKHNWANAVLINNNDQNIKNKFYNSDGSLKCNNEINIEKDILQMYVWIPRYKYQLFNAVNKTSSNPQEIIIKFESGKKSTGNVSCVIATNGKETCTNDTNGNWYTHPAFTFGSTELSGFWVGKFEPSDYSDSIGRNSNIGEITILPNKTSMVNKNILTLFNATRAIEKTGNKYNLKPEEVDTHPMKNREWGAVAYLASSIYGIYTNTGTGCVIGGMTKSNCEIWNNNVAQGTASSGTYEYGGTATGCVGNSINSSAKWSTDGTKPAECAEGYKWNQNGVKASTTGNIYGIYDMSGGAWEYIMGVTANKTGTGMNYGTSGFDQNTVIDSKYYDLYEYSNTDTTHERGHLGDATRETLSIFGNGAGGWNTDQTDFPHEGASYSTTWFIRGNTVLTWMTERTGIFAVGRGWGAANFKITFRPVLSAS